MDLVLSCVSTLLSELQYRVQDNSLLNADIPSYTPRIEAAITNVSRLGPGHQVLIQALQSIRESLPTYQNGNTDSDMSATQPTRLYTGILIHAAQYSSASFT